MKVKAKTKSTTCAVLREITDVCQLPCHKFQLIGIRRSPLHAGVARVELMCCATQIRSFHLFSFEPQLH